MLSFQIRQLGANHPSLQPQIDAFRMPRQLQVGCRLREVRALLQQWAPSVQVRFTEQEGNGEGKVITRPSGEGRTSSVTFALRSSADESRLGLLLYALGAQTVLQASVGDEGERACGLRSAISRMMSGQDEAAPERWVKPAGWFCALIWSGLLGFDPQIVLAELLLLATEARPEGDLARIMAATCPDWADASVWRDVLQSSMSHAAFIKAGESERHRMIAATAASLATVIVETERESSSNANDGRNRSAEALSP